MKMMISNLPRDLIEEILSRLPLKSTSLMRLVCKKWNTISKTRSFREMHIGKGVATKEGESMMIVLMGYNLYLMSIVFDVDPSIESKGKLSCLEEQVKISQIYHCEGLLLCILEEDNTKFVVWNPYFGHTTWIEFRCFHRPKGSAKFSYALGYEDKKSCRSYKFLRFIDLYFGEPEGRFFEIYDFDSGLWKTLDVTPHGNMLFGSSGVSLKGNTYFYASDLNSEGEINNYIICFDFTKERFVPFLTLPFTSGLDCSVALSCVREEKLAVLLQRYEGNPYELDVWITTKIGEAQGVSCIKFLTVKTEFNKRYPFIRGGFVIDEEKKVVMGFKEYKRKTLQIIGEAGYYRQLDLLKRKDNMPRVLVCPYGPSLVQIQQLS